MTSEGRSGFVRLPRGMVGCGVKDDRRANQKDRGRQACIGIRQSTVLHIVIVALTD